MYKEHNNSENLLKLTNELIENLNTVSDKIRDADAIMLKMKLKSAINSLPYEIAKTFEGSIGKNNISNIEKLKRIIKLQQLLTEFKDSLQLIHILKLYKTDKLLRTIEEIKSLTNKMFAVKRNLIN